MSVGGLATAVVVVPMAIITVVRRVVSNQFFFMDFLRCICGVIASAGGVMLASRRRVGPSICWPHNQDGAVSDD